jgi:hypothetical protein
MMHRGCGAAFPLALFVGLVPTTSAVLHVAHGPGTVWVVGERQRAIGPDPDYAWHPPFVLRRRGGIWISIPVPRVVRALLEAAVVVGSGDVWALGAVQAETVRHHSRTTAVPDTRPHPRRKLSA